jgi:hypothetical protein
MLHHSSMLTVGWTGGQVAGEGARRSMLEAANVDVVVELVRQLAADVVNAGVVVELARQLAVEVDCHKTRTLLGRQPAIWHGRSHCCTCHSC